MTKPQKVKNVKALTMAYANLERVYPTSEAIDKAKRMVLNALYEMESVAETVRVAA